MFKPLPTNPVGKTETIAALIQRAIEEDVKRAIEEEAAAAAARVYDRVRAATGSIVARVASTYSYEQMRGELIIRVKFEEPHTPSS